MLHGRKPADEYRLPSLHTAGEKGGGYIVIIAHNGTCTMHCNLATDIRIARETGYQGIEIIGSKLYRHLNEGHTIESVRERLAGFPVVALGFVPDIERQAPEEYEALLQECERMCSAAEQLDCDTVQILTGPLGPGLGDFDGYMGLTGKEWKEVRDLTAKNLKVLADIGKKHKVRFYLESLSWAPIHTLDQTLELIDAAGKDNVGLVVDFWHMWTSGVRPEDLAKVDKNLIYGAHYCDSLPVPAGMETISHDLRHIWSGGGQIPLKEWVDAVCSTGYDGWWACELFSPKHWELDPWEVAGLLRRQLEILLV